MIVQGVKQLYPMMAESLEIVDNEDMKGELIIYFLGYFEIANFVYFCQKYEFRVSFMFFLAIIIAGDMLNLDKQVFCGLSMKETSSFKFFVILFCSKFSISII